MPSEIVTLKYRHVSFAVKYVSVLFPFDILQFIKAIPQKGFIVPERLIPSSLGTRLEVSGTIGRKADVSIRIDADRQVLAIDASSPPFVLEELDSVESLLKSEFDLESSSLAQYYEFTAVATVRTKVNPLELWPRHFRMLPILDEFCRILGVDVSPFGLRVTPKGQVPNQENWFDMRIEPLVQSPRTHQLVEVVFRRSQRKEVYAFIGSFESTVGALNSVMEG